MYGTYDICHIILITVTNFRNKDSKKFPGVLFEKTLFLNTLCLKLYMEKVYTFRGVVSARKTPPYWLFFLRRTV